MRLGIISALEEEQQGLVEAMQGPARLVHGMRTYTSGQIAGLDAVCVLSRIGKVAAATTATMLIEKFGVTHLLFTGVAGAGDAGVRVGDIVVAESLVQYDMDASPCFPPSKCRSRACRIFPPTSICPTWWRARRMLLSIWIFTAPSMTASAGHLD